VILSRTNYRRVRLAVCLIIAMVAVSGCVGARMGVSWPAVGLVTVNGEQNIALAYNNDVAILSPVNGAPLRLINPVTGQAMRDSENNPRSWILHGSNNDGAQFYSLPIVIDAETMLVAANSGKLLLTAIQEDRLPVSKLGLPLLTKLMGRLEGEFRPRAEQVYLDSGLEERLKSFRAAAAWYDLDPTERSRLGELQSEVKDQLKESNRPEAAPDGVDLLRAVQERGQAPSTIFAVLADSVEGEESAPSP